jgi:hypothetical protein
MVLDEVVELAAADKPFVLFELFADKIGVRSSTRPDYCFRVIDQSIEVLRLKTQQITCIFGR